MLRANFPVLFVLIHQSSARDNAYFRLVDAAFRERLIEFLTSDKATTSVLPADCLRWDELPVQLAELRKPGFVETQRIRAATLRLAKVLDGATIEILRDGHGSQTLITTTDLYSAFDRLSNKEADDLYVATFGAAALSSDRIRSLALRTEVISELRGLPRPFVLAGMTVAADTRFRVDGPDGTADVEFTELWNGEHKGWTDPRGFALTASKRKRQGNLWIHELEAFADPEVEVPLESLSADLLKFLACCVPGSRLGPLNSGGLPFLAEEFAFLPQFAWAVRYVGRASKLAGWEPGLVPLRDAMQPKVLDALAWLAALSDNANAVMKLAFTLDAEEPSAPARFEVPTIVDLNGRSIVAWARCSGRVLLIEEQIKGLAIDDVHSVQLQLLLPRWKKVTADPEFLLAENLVIARGSTGFYVVSKHRKPPVVLHSVELI